MYVLITFDDFISFQLACTDNIYSFAVCNVGYVLKDTVLLDFQSWN